MRFKKEVYPRDRQFFRELARGQNPKALFITCADSRIVPDLITQSRPGDLFVCRTIGNQVPAYGSGADTSVSACIEYAVRVLNIQDVIVCGHSDCGAMKGLLHPEKVAALPAVSTWLRNAAAARSVVIENYGDISDDVLLHLLCEENVVAQIENLKTHPSVAARVACGKLRLHGWVYHIHSGEVVTYDGKSRSFVPLGMKPVDATPPARIEDLRAGGNAA
jgi:carbonic anhydrase